MKIVDFGLSRILMPGKELKDSFGTLLFVAPEILIDIDYSFSVDIWSLAVVAYFMF